jgi:SRSO17 transposase
MTTRLVKKCKKGKTDSAGAQFYEPSVGQSAAIASLSDLATGFFEFIGTYRKHFLVHTDDRLACAQSYLCGLMQGGRHKNMERMEEAVAGMDYQSTQHFITNSPWSARAVMDDVACRMNRLLGGEQNTCLILDESGLVKKGEKSVGVGRQYLGRLGKVDNGQVAVFAALGCQDEVSLTDVRLYLPEDWVKDKPRCDAANIPPEHQVYKTKLELALEIVAHARELKLEYQWVCADGLYGNSYEFAQKLDETGEIYTLNVHKDQRVYLEDPKPVPVSKKGKNSEKLQAQTPPIRVDKPAMDSPEDQWKLQKLRPTTKGDLYVEALHYCVWVWDGKEDEARQVHLVVTRDPETKLDIKYGLSNAPEQTTPKRLAYMMHQRFWIERAFEDGKSETGLADYQVRGWQAWHHHMALVFMAMQFMLQTRILYKEPFPLLSCGDVEELLAHFLPRKDVTKEQILEQLLRRHKKHLSSIESAYRKTEGRYPEQGYV